MSFGERSMLKSRDFARRCLDGWGLQEEAACGVWCGGVSGWARKKEERERRQEGGRQEEEEEEMPGGDDVRAREEGR